MTLILALLACSADPIASTVTNNPDIVVETLFTKDGCTVYRFEDSHSRYYVVCDNPCKTASTFTTESCGKNCTENVQVPTVTR